MAYQVTYIIKSVYYMLKSIITSTFWLSFLIGLLIWYFFGGFAGAYTVNGLANRDRTFINYDNQVWKWQDYDVYIQNPWAPWFIYWSWTENYPWIPDDARNYPTHGKQSRILPLWFKSWVFTTDLFIPYGSNQVKEISLPKSWLLSRIYRWTAWWFENIELNNHSVMFRQENASAPFGYDIQSVICWKTFNNYVLDFADNAYYFTDIFNWIVYKYPWSDYVTPPYMNGCYFYELMNNYSPSWTYKLLSFNTTFSMPYYWCDWRGCNNQTVSNDHPRPSRQSAEDPKLYQANAYWWEYPSSPVWYWIFGVSDENLLDTSDPEFWSDAPPWDSWGGWYWGSPSPELSSCLESANLLPVIINNLKQCYFQTSANIYLTRTGQNEHSLLMMNTDLRNDSEYLIDLYTIFESNFCKNVAIDLNQLLFVVKGWTWDLTDPIKLSVFNWYINEIYGRSLLWWTSSLGTFSPVTYCKVNSINHWTENGMPPGWTPPEFEPIDWDEFQNSADSNFTLNLPETWPFGFLWTWLNKLNFTEGMQLTDANPYWSYCKYDKTDMNNFQKIILFMLVRILVSYIFTLWLRK